MRRLRHTTVSCASTPACHCAGPASSRSPRRRSSFGDIVVVGSAIGDNARVEAPRGTVRAFDARSGAPKWSWDPVPRDAIDAVRRRLGRRLADRGPRQRVGADVGRFGAWPRLSADIEPESGLLRWLAPRRQPAREFGGRARRRDRCARVGRIRSSITTCGTTTRRRSRPWRRSTCRKARQTSSSRAPSRASCSCSIATPGSRCSRSRNGWYRMAAHLESGSRRHNRFRRTCRRWCRIVCAPTMRSVSRRGTAARAASRSPPRATTGSTRRRRSRARIVFPMTGGGVNWGGVAFDPVHQLVYANTNRAAHRVTLFPAARFDELRARYPEREVSPQRGAPFGMIREVLLSPLGMPCTPPPWGAIAALESASRQAAVGIGARHHRRALHRSVWRCAGERRTSAGRW